MSTSVMNYVVENANSLKKEDQDLLYFSKTLDDDWIKQFEKDDLIYQDFYRENNYYMNIKVLYVNHKNELERIKTESFLFSSPNTITKSELMELLMKYSIDGNKRYSLLSILIYNITLDAEDVKKSLMNHSSPSRSSYLKPMSSIDTIHLQKTITMMQDLNDLIFVLYEKITLSDEVATAIKQQQRRNQTKRVSLIHASRFSKTVRKRYKD